MPIQSVIERTAIPVVGKIRLGERQVAKSGKQYPSNVEYFVLKDAPGVEAVYGKDPKEIEVIFLSDDIDEAIPTWLKWYSAGKVDASGKAIGGDLNCIGNGPDANGNPGTAQYRMMRDPRTGVTPSRPCLGEKCPDWRDSAGNPKCKQSMQVVCILPRVTWKGCFIIETSSWRSIRAFHNQLSHIRNMNGGQLRGIPWKIFRKEEAVAHTGKDGTRSVRNHHIMKIDVMDNFSELYGKESAARLNSMKNLSLAPNVSQENLLAAATEDFYPVSDNEEDFRRLAIQRGENPDVYDVEARKQSIEDVANDPEVLELFKIYGEVLGSSISPKGRMMAIRKKEQEPNIKEAVIETLHEKIKEARAKAEAKVEAKVEAPTEPNPPAGEDKNPAFVAAQVSAPKREVREAEVVTADGELF